MGVGLVGCVFTRTVGGCFAPMVRQPPRPRGTMHPTAEVFDYFVQITGGKGHLTRMQAVLKAYVEAMR